LISRLAVRSRAPLFVCASLAGAVALDVIALPISHLEYANWTEAAVHVAAASSILGMLVFVASCAVDILRPNERDPPET
jgi:hypothetical protein